ncbi:SPOR domain-containing protein [Ectobacillus ponti]|uniref:SPOR domain-containing protein n=1 Tax=Ectobacillus ponti TaxID=2961894 RepID=A0AA41X639_9BACI|nr:SPOR domain-containing protein [Ectobacillus ponti]MCP8967324.1 SPOR domain-containing protein [Ectobacillus ponti]
MDKQSPKILVRVNGVKTSYTEADETQKDEFQWILPEESEPSYNNVVPFRAEAQTKPAKQQNRAGKRIAITVGAAVMLGTGFGFGMLQLLNGGSAAQTVPASVPPAAAPVKQEAAAAPAKLQVLQLHMVQSGVFSKKENGEAALADAKKKGLPAYLASEDGKYRLFTGLASNKETADKLLNKQQGTYKAWQVPEGKLPAAYEPYSALIVKGESLFSALVEQSSAVYTSGKPDTAKQGALEKEVQALVKESGKVKQEEIKKFVTYISLSYDALKDYETKQGEASFTKLQQLLFEGLASYQNLLPKA